MGRLKFDVDGEELTRLREALEEIRDLDYRGNRHASARIAEQAIGEDK